MAEGPVKTLTTEAYSRARLTPSCNLCKKASEYRWIPCDSVMRLSWEPAGWDVLLAGISCLRGDPVVFAVVALGRSHKDQPEQHLRP